MAARDLSGTIRSFSVEGIAFRVAADASFNEILTRFENSMIPTSGAAMRKMVKRVPTRESIVLVTNADERDTLISFAESPDYLKFSYTNAAGDTYKAEGVMEIEGNATDENRTTLQVMPRNGWTTFIGG